MCVKMNCRILIGAVGTFAVTWKNTLNHYLMRRVFPARAGMNRTASYRPRSTVSVPRPRGDEPRILERFGCAKVVFPARAGMSRTAGRLRSAQGW